MQTIRLAAFGRGAGMRLVLGCSSRGGTSLHREWILATALARRHRERPMARTFTSVFCCEGYLHILRAHATYFAGPARRCRGKSGRSVTCLADSFLGGATPIWTSTRNHRTFRSRTTAIQSPHCHFSLGKGVV